MLVVVIAAAAAFFVNFKPELWITLTALSCAILGASAGMLAWHRFMKANPAVLAERADKSRMRPAFMVMAGWVLLAACIFPAMDVTLPAVLTAAVGARYSGPDRVKDVRKVEGKRRIGCAFDVALERHEITLCLAKEGGPPPKVGDRVIVEGDVTAAGIWIHEIRPL